MKVDTAKKCRVGIVRVFFAGVHSKKIVPKKTMGTLCFAHPTNVLLVLLLPQFSNHGSQA